MNAEFCNKTDPYQGATATTYKRLSTPTAQGGLSSDSKCDLNAIRVPNQTVNVRELLSFMPWYFSDGPGAEQLIPSDRCPTTIPMLSPQP